MAQTQLRVKLGKYGAYRNATLLVDIEKPEPSVGFRGSVTVEGIEIDPADARDLLIEVVQQKIERALSDAIAFGTLDGLRVDL